MSCVPGRYEDDAAGARHAGEAEQPQEDSVQNHRHVFPVVRHLDRGGDVRGFAVRELSAASGNLNSLNSLDVKIECVWIEN